MSPKQRPYKDVLQLYLYCNKERELPEQSGDWGKRYPHAGYGGSFRHWLKENNPKPYGSYGNGSAMRVSSAGWLYDSIERREVARATANVTHNHPEGIKGAEAFYGIPAVLIAECKSRIDKGLMTDVLDEFDNVLGSRSVDTYLDEVDETQANKMIEAAIDKYY